MLTKPLEIGDTFFIAMIIYDYTKLIKVDEDGVEWKSQKKTLVRNLAEEVVVGRFVPTYEGVFEENYRHKMSYWVKDHLVYYGPTINPDVYFQVSASAEYAFHTFKEADEYLNNQI